ncbi:ATP-dependent helicase [Paenibacillus sp. BGI2013]|uniref:UvrD-helicase domain-containing protein n=1 Tax=Paenibacillus sp. BGI2013 TaxID=2058902 RepID=UPI000C6D6FF5|nr:UvrD-helicase domain-containing protein [Paenibacillus sp. BGI2013]PKQ89046.1 ATP-dependent helicase [Paenibacillus sp. BGI2013]
MVEEQLEVEVEQIFKLISNGHNFLLSGGAGSGKTYSLIMVIKKAIRDNPTAKIACITYTNAAVKEIKDRIDHNNLYVMTIHEFLWSMIKPFQRNLKKELISLINDENSKFASPDGIVDKGYFDSIESGIQYKDYVRIREGIISHDEVLELSNLMYKKYPLLCDILKDNYRFIFIDEYQDTSQLVIEIFLDHLKQSKKKNIIGFFGDSMQSIYDKGVGDLYKYIEKQDVKEIWKRQNRRNPSKVINLANNLRSDGLIQEPSLDNKAPNMLKGFIREGNIKFLYSSNNDLNEIRKTEYFAGWNFNDSKQTKELYLTHNLIAPKAGFPELMEIYDKDPIIDLKNKIKEKIKKDNIEINEDYSFDQVVDLIALKNRSKLRKDIITENPIHSVLYDELKNELFSKVSKIYLNKDSLIDDKKQEEQDINKEGSKRDALIKHLFKIQTIIQLYKDKLYNDFIRKTELKITSINMKKEINETISIVDQMFNSTIEEVIDFVDERRLCRKDDNFYNFINENEYIFNRVKKVKYQEFQNLFYYLEGHTPFSTQHKIKGSEFDNVLVILDNGKWNDYNFDYLFSRRTEKETIFLRTQKIFYVCCTRAKENLIVFYHNPSEIAINQAKLWFGEENVKKI